MSCQNVLEKCRDISATQTRRGIFWQKNEISTYRRFQLSPARSSRARPSASVVLSRRADPLVLHRPLPLLLPLPPPLGAQAILPARSSRACPSASVTVSRRAPSPVIVALSLRVDCCVDARQRRGNAQTRLRFKFLSYIFLMIRMSMSN